MCVDDDRSLPALIEGLVDDVQMLVRDLDLAVEPAVDNDRTQVVEGVGEFFRCLDQRRDVRVERAEHGGE
jgi:hypothetical protein